MALNKNIQQKIADKTAGDQYVYDAIIDLLKGVDEGKQLKRIIDPIIKTI